MWSWRRRDDDAEVVEETRREDVVDERAGASPGLIRALFTLAGVAGAGALIWAAQLFDLDSTDGFWGAMAVLAAAGFVLGLSQLLGGWTKWGFPTISPTVFLVGFLPTFVVGAWLLLVHQPDGGWQQSRFEGWNDDLGLASFTGDISIFLPVVPLIVGLVLAFTFDTTGPRTRIVDAEREREVVRPVTTAAPVVADDVNDVDDETVAEQLRRDREADDVVADDVDDTEEATVAEQLRREREAGDADPVPVGSTDDTMVDSSRRTEDT